MKPFLLLLVALALVVPTPETIGSPPPPPETLKLTLSKELEEAGWTITSTAATEVDKERGVVMIIELKNENIRKLFPCKISGKNYVEHGRVRLTVYRKAKIGDALKAAEEAVAVWKKEMETKPSQLRGPSPLRIFWRTDRLVLTIEEGPLVQDHQDVLDAIRRQLLNM